MTKIVSITIIIIILNHHHHHHHHHNLLSCSAYSSVPVNQIQLDNAYSIKPIPISNTKRLQIGYYAHTIGSDFNFHWERVKIGEYQSIDQLRNCVVNLNILPQMFWIRLSLHLAGRIFRCTSSSLTVTLIWVGRHSQPTKMSFCPDGSGGPGGSRPPCSFGLLFQRF